jgi:hypothetical protein
MHEAGVANELEEMGYDFVPRSVYVELDDGTPAIVREYGEPVERGELSGQEFYELEKALFGLEKGTGWRVHDELLLLRRPDGSLFIGDVGLWQAPPLREKLPEWNKLDSALPSIFEGLAERVFGQSVASISRVEQLRERLADEDFPDFFREKFEEELEKALASRRALGIPS